MSFDRELLSFVRQSLPSVWALEVLLTLKREPETVWSAEALVVEHRASEQVVAGVLADLQRAGIVVGEAEGVRYAPASPVIVDLCDRIEAAYRERPVAVIKAISAPPDRLQALADAFRIKGDGA